LSKYEELKKYLCWDKLKIFYAMKANYNPHILKIMRDHGFYLDTVSPAEVILAISLGFKKDHILFTANNMTDHEMILVRQQGVVFNIDSLSRLESYARCYPGASISLRINPDVIAGENEKVQTAGDFSKFGILLIDVPEALKISKQYDIKIIGLHEHTGSGVSDVAKVHKSMKNLLDIANRQDFPDLEFIDFGGGFKVRYHPEEAAIDYMDFGTKTVRLFDRFCEHYGKKLDLYFEPGKYIVTEAGCLIVRVNTVRNNKGKLIIGTDSGFPHLIRPVLYGAYHHILNISNPFGALKKYDIYGNICESGDCFASDREIPEIRNGDYLAILNTGAYCRSMASEYNLRPLPSEYIIYNNEILVSKQKLTHSELAGRVLMEYGINE
jgi:diaminopimelate decarboxylase